MLRRLLVFIAALGLLTPAVAFAGSRERILRDCQDGHMDGHYSQREYADALANIPTDVDEYTDCRDVIRRSQLGAAGRPSKGGRSGPAGGGGSSGAGPGGPSGRDPLASATHRERAKLERARSKATTPVAIGGRLVEPGPLGYQSMRSLSTIPTALLVALILLGAAAAASAGVWVRARVVARRTR